jgi:hypothetical protein
VPTGIELERSLRAELQRGNPAAAEPLALWLAFHCRAEEALPLVENARRPAERRLAGLIRWKGMGEPLAAVEHLEAGPLDDPVAIAELDELYAELGQTERRAALLVDTSEPPTADVLCHPLLIERRADLALQRGEPEETLRLLRSTRWQRQHQRYVRTDLWNRATATLGIVDQPPPAALGEDRLAQFGAYWSEVQRHVP